MNAMQAIEKWNSVKSYEELSKDDCIEMLRVLTEAAALAAPEVAAMIGGIRIIPVWGVDYGAPQKP